MAKLNINNRSEDIKKIHNALEALNIDASSVVINPNRFGKYFDCYEVMEIKSRRDSAYPEEPFLYNHTFYIYDNILNDENLLKIFLTQQIIENTDEYANL